MSTTHVNINSKPKLVFCFSSCHIGQKAFWVFPEHIIVLLVGACSLLQVFSKRETCVSVWVYTEQVYMMLLAVWFRAHRIISLYIKLRLLNYKFNFNNFRLNNLGLSFCWTREKDKTAKPAGHRNCVSNIRVDHIGFASRKGEKL